MRLSHLILCLALALSSAWAQPPSAAPPALREPLDINSATAPQLAILPGIGKVYSSAIVKGRPYARKDELVTRKIVPQSVYNQVKDLIIAKQVTPKPKAK